MTLQAIRGGDRNGVRAQLDLEAVPECGSGGGGGIGRCFLRPSFQLDPADQRQVLAIMDPGYIVDQPWTGLATTAGLSSSGRPYNLQYTGIMVHTGNGIELSDTHIS